MKTVSINAVAETAIQYVPKRSKRIVYESINDINGIRCARCNTPTMTKDKIHEFLQRFQLPSFKALKNKIYDGIRETEGFQFIKKLSDQHPHTSLKKLVQEENNAAAISKLDKATFCDVMRIMQQSKKLDGSASSFVAKFKNQKRFLPGDKQLILNQLEVWAKKYPGKSVGEILGLPEIRTQTRALIQAYKRDSITARKAIFRNVKTMSQKLDSPTQLQLEKLEDEAIKIIKKGGDPIKVKIKIKDLYKDFLNKNCNKETKKEILSQIFKLDLGDQNPYKYFKNSIGCHDQDLAEKLIKGRTSTFEHVNAKSHGGSDRRGNGSVLCSHCNGERSNRDLPEFLEDNPQMIFNAKAQVKQVQSYIRRKQLINHDLYPLEIKKTYAEQTEGRIDIEIKDYCESQLKSLIKEYKEYKKQINDTGKVINNSQTNTERVINKLLDELGI